MHPSSAVQIHSIMRFDYMMQKHLFYCILQSQVPTQATLQEQL